MTGLIFFYSQSTVIFYATNGPIYGLDSHNKSYLREDDLIMFYCCKGGIIYRVIGLGTWCGRPKSQQRGGKLWLLPDFNCIYK